MAVAFSVLVALIALTFGIVLATHHHDLRGGAFFVAAVGALIIAVLARRR